MVSIQLKQLEGRDHWVVPTVLITEGVFSGNQGPVYYPADTLRDTAHLWNGKPVVVYHPDMYFGSAIAGHPDVFNRQKVGVLFNARYEAKAVKADAWLDCQRLLEVDPRITEAINQRQMLEVSTGLFVPGGTNRGTFNGASYDKVALNITPDHLAILPDRRGACSIADGAGLIRNVFEVEQPLPLPVLNWN